MNVVQWWKTIASDVEQDSLVVLMKSYSFGITENPKIKFEFFDGDTLLLSGVRKKRSHIYTEEEIEVVESAMIGGALFGAIGGAIGEGMKRDSINDKFSYSIAAFPITHEQIEMFQLGVRAISVTSAPIMHKRQFKKDKIGKNLYKMYIRRQSEKQK